MFGKVLGDYASLHPLSVAMWRMLVGGLGLAVWLVATRRLRLASITRAGWARILGTGAFTALFEGSFFSAINLTSVGFSTLIAIGATPVLVAVYTSVRGRSRPAPRTIIALVLALAGLTLLLSGSLDAGRNGLIGAGLALTTAVAFAGVTVINREPVPGLPAALLTSTAFTAAGLMLVPFALAAGVGAPSDAAGWGLVAVIGIVTTGVAYLFFLTGLQTVTPTVATIVTLLEPLIAAVLGALVLSESLGAWGIAGGVLLAFAVVILRPERDEPR